MMKFKMFKKVMAAIVALAAIAMPARAQMSGQVSAVPLGYCQLATLTSATFLSSCVRATFTGTGTGTTLAVSAVTGYVKPGDTVTGTGVPAGTYVVAQLTGSAGGTGNYQTNQPTTSAAASLSSGGIPQGANSAVIRTETQAVRYTDDNTVAPTATTGQLLNTADPSFWYQGALANLQFIQAAASAKLNVTFYKTP
jgi:hypothetical protein